MKNHPLFALALLLIISIPACKKSTTSPSGSYYFNFSVNGVTRNIDSAQFAEISVNTNGNNRGEIILMGRSKSIESGNIEIILANEIASLQVGTYSDTMSNILLSADFNGYSSGIWEMNTAKILGKSISTHLVLNISSISDSTVMGTFSGDFYQAPNFTTPMLITDGRFNLKTH